MCSGSEAGSYLRLIDFVYHSTLGLRVIKKKMDTTKEATRWRGAGQAQSRTGCIDTPGGCLLCILVYLVTYDSGYVSLEHLLLSRYPTLSLSSVLERFLDSHFSANGSTLHSGTRVRGDQISVLLLLLYYSQA